MELTLDKVLQKAVEAQKVGKVQEADRLYTVILQAQSKHPDANHNMGVLAVNAGKLQESLPFFKTALEANPSIGQYWLSFIDTLIKLGRIADAKAIFDQARKRGAPGEAFKQLEKQLSELGANSPRPNQTQLQSIVSLYNQGHLKQALSESSKMLKKFPSSVELYNIVGCSNAGLRQFDAALDSYKQALKIKPNYADVYNNMGNAFQAKGDLGQALDSYKRAIKINPDYADAYNNMGNAFQAKDDLRQALDSYKRAIEINSNYAEAYNNMAGALKRDSNPEAAIKNYKQAIKIKPDYADAHSNLGLTLQDLGRFELAEKSYRQALNIKPSNTLIQYSLDAMTGVQTNTAPREYVEFIFDNYAAHFEDSLVGKLNYEVPETLSKIMVSSKHDQSLGSILDLGCGTGLAGIALKPYCSNLEGIDLSNSMLKEAERKNIYNKLTQTDIIEYLSESELDFDYFVCADVFVYVGDLSRVFELMKSRNKRKATLAFSTEHTKGNRFFLERSGRYSHSKTYIENLCEEFGYQITHFSTTNLRKERGKFIEGGLYLLNF